MARLRPRDVVGFWFGDDRHDEAPFEAWFDPDERTRQGIVDFEPTVERALSHRLDRWARRAPGRVALILLLDVFPRHLWPGTRHAFEGDRHAQSLALETLASGRGRAWPPEHRATLLLPLLHAEDGELQERAVEGFDLLVRDHGERFRPFLERAMERQEVVRRFGRFPHRNALLGRATTDQEAHWLATEAPAWVRARLPDQTSMTDP